VYRSMTVRRAVALTLGLLFLGAAAVAAPQDQISDDSASAAIAATVAHGKPVNIKVLPKDISRGGNWESHEAL